MFVIGTQLYVIKTDHWAIDIRTIRNSGHSEHNKQMDHL